MARSIEVSPDVAALLDKLAAATDKTPAQVLCTSVERYADLLVGCGPEAKDKTGVFLKLKSDRPAAARLLQRSATDFYLVEPFRYIGPDQTVFEVPAIDTLDPYSDVTDLASVPDALLWLVPRYGRHTLPALLHDDLQDEVKKHKMPSRQADFIFRGAMKDTLVPFVRRWLMWAAVSVRTRWNLHAFWKIAIVMWALVYGPGFWAGMGLLAATSVPWWGSLLIVAGALVSPLVLSAFWRWERSAGFIFAYGVIVVTLPLIFVMAATGVYSLAEVIAKIWDKGRPIRTKALDPSRAERPHLKRDQCGHMYYSGEASSQEAPLAQVQAV